MEAKGLTMAIIFQMESFSGNETTGIVKSRKRILEGKVYQHSYIPIQTLRHNIINQMGVDYKEVDDKTVLQFASEATIDKYPEIDLFGYVKKTEEQKVRIAITRLSNAVSLENFECEDGIDRSYYVYTISIDLDKVGIDENDNIEIENTEKTNRVIDLLDTIRYLHIDVNGGKKYLEPLFIIGGVYNFEDAIFHDIMGVENNRIDIGKIKDVLKNVPYENVEEDTYCGLVEGVFDNDSEIEKELDAKSISEYFEIIKGKIADYYQGN